MLNNKDQRSRVEILVVHDFNKVYMSSVYVVVYLKWVFCIVKGVSQDDKVGKKESKRKSIEHSF